MDSGPGKKYIVEETRGVLESRLSTLGMGLYCKNETLGGTLRVRDERAA
jgi:hypothetical protein